MTLQASSSDELMIGRLAPSHVAELMMVQSAVCVHLAKPELYFPVTEPEMAELVGPSGLCCGAFHGDKLVGFFGVLFMGDRAGNVGEDLGLDTQDLPLVAYFKAVNVLPQYRGRGLQERLTKALFTHMGVSETLAPQSQVAEDLSIASGLPPFKWLCSTVSPLNVASLKTFLDHGFCVAGMKPKYLGYQRCLLLRKRWARHAKQETSIVVPLEDYGIQADLLKRGMVGSALDFRHSTPKIHYIQGDR